MQMQDARGEAERDERHAATLQFQDLAENRRNQGAACKLYQALGLPSFVLENSPPVTT